MVTGSQLLEGWWRDLLGYGCAQVMGRPGVQGPDTGETQQLSPVMGRIRRARVCLCRYARRAEHQQQGARHSGAHMSKCQQRGRSMIGGVTGQTV